MTEPRRALPEPVRAALTRLGAALQDGQPAPEFVADAVAGLGGLPSELAAAAEGDVRSAARLHGTYVRTTGPEHYALSHRVSDRVWLDAAPGSELVFLFHGSGYLREAALDRVAAGLTTPFWVTALALRLNDWVPDVRRAAADCVGRVFPKTSAEVLAPAAAFLLVRVRHWRRWGGEATALDAALRRPDVLHCLAETVGNASTGPAAAVLREVMQFPEGDVHLLSLATRAQLPTVRSTAMQTLIAGEAVWPTGWERQWVDKSMGLSRRIRTLGRRAMIRPLPVANLIRIAAADRSVLVRRAAADGLIRFRSGLSDMEDLVEVLSRDRSRAVRERAEFLLRTSRFGT